MAKTDTTDTDPDELVETVDLGPAVIGLPATRLPDPEPEPPAPVKARWVDVQAVVVPGQGLIRYGDPIYVSAEQLDSGAHPTIRWDDTWLPNGDLLAQSTLEG